VGSARLGHRPLGKAGRVHRLQPSRRNRVDVEKDVNVEVDKGQLVIRGERHDERSEEKDGRTLSEVRYGSFRRSFKLPAHVTSDAITASYDAGVLTVRVAGAHKGAEAQRIAIESK